LVYSKSISCPWSLNQRDTSVLLPARASDRWLNWVRCDLLGVPEILLHLWRALRKKRQGRSERRLAFALDRARANPQVGLNAGRADPIAFHRTLPGRENYLESFPIRAPEWRGAGGIRRICRNTGG
jgi:hypothetical protein